MLVMFFLNKILLRLSDVVSCSLCKLIATYLFEEVGRDIGGGKAGLQAFEMDDDTLLSGDAGYAAHDALEGAGGDTNQIVGHEPTGFEVDFHHMFVKKRCCLDKRLHIPAADSQRRVVACFVCNKMVVIESRVFRQLGIDDVLCGLLFRHVCKKKVHERKQLPLLLARLFVTDVLPHFCQIDVCAIFNYGICHSLGLTILNAENKPFSFFTRGIPYRHPCF